MVGPPNVACRSCFILLVAGAHSRPIPSRANLCGSEHIDRRETGLSRDAVPKVNRKADVAGPERIPSTPDNEVSAAILYDGRHGELARAVEPDGIVGAAVEF